MANDTDRNDGDDEANGGEKKKELDGCKSRQTGSVCGHPIREGRDTHLYSEETN